MPDGSTKRFRDQELAIYTFLVRTKIVAHVKQEGYRVIDVLPAGDAHAFLVAVYKDPRADPLDRKDAAKAALPYEKSRPVTVTLASVSPAGDVVRVTVCHECRRSRD